jgi:hypothetical protein
MKNDSSTTAISPGESSATTPTSPSDSYTTGNCSGLTFLDRRLKVFRTHDKALWFFWVDSVYSNQYSTTSKTKTSTTYTILDPMLPANGGVITESLANEENILFFTRTTNESLEASIDTAGALKDTTYWAVYEDDNKKLQPLKNVMYFDMWYDINQHTLDLVFWSNVLIDALGSYSPKDSASLYPTYSVASVDTHSGSNNLNPNAQRVVFYCRGMYKSMITTRKTVNTTTKKSTVNSPTTTGLFVFSQPMLLLCPGRAVKSRADAVVDIATIGSNFIEFAQ